jgi:hypothetical protein
VVIETEHTQMTTTEALAQSHSKPVAFIKGSHGIEGWYGKIFHQGRVIFVRYQGQWNYDSRERALKATKWLVRQMAEVAA